MKNLILLGRVPRETVNYEMSRCAALLNLSSAESYGLTLLEAQAIGTPVFSIDKPYAREVLEGRAVYFTDKSDLIDSFKSFSLMAKKKYVLDYYPKFDRFQPELEKVFG